MNAPLLLAPHNDDAELFAAFTCVRDRPHVVVALRSTVQEQRGYGISHETRERETDEAMRILGCTWEQWEFPEDLAHWPAVELRLRELDADALPGRVFAPRPERDGGHAHHDALGELADRVFGPDRVTRYLTYTTSGKSTDGEPVAYEPAWVGLKLQALACYRSQSGHKTCAEHFLRDQHEFYERR